MPPGTESEPIRVAIAGVGSLGRRLAEQFRELDDATLVTIADVDELALRSTGDALGIGADSRYTVVERMLREESLDAIGIATPNGLHYEQLIAALDRDLHVLCEKPLATSVADATELVRRAESTDRTVMVGYQRHLNPAFGMARDRWADGSKTPRFITGEITQDWRSYFDEMSNWRMDPELSGGGHLLNVGTHIIDAILWTTELTPTHVIARVDFHDEAQILDRQSAAVIEFDNGAIATVSDTGVVARTREHIHIWDDEGAVYLEGREWEDRTGYVIDETGTEHNPYFGYDRRLAKGRAFLDSIRKGTEPPITVRDGLLATLVTMAIYEAGRSGERVELAESYPEAMALLDSETH